MIARRTLAPFAAVLLTAGVGCVAQPQNSEEFRKCITDGHGKKDSYTVNRPFEEVFQNLKDKAEAGFNQRHETTLMSGMQIEHSVLIFRCKMSKDGERGDLVIQKQNRQALGPTMPEGGWYWFVADVESVSRQETRMTTYALSGIGSGRTRDVLEALKLWAQGKDAPAPSLR